MEIGNPLGTYDTNSVRDRVRQWQAQGGGVMTADDVDVDEDQQPKISMDDRKTSKREYTLRTPLKSEHSNSKPDSRSRSSRKHPHIDSEKGIRTRSKSAPAKRIVSDAHWKKKRSPPKTQNSSKIFGDTSSVRGTVVNGDIRVPPVPYSGAEDIHKVRGQRRPLRYTSFVGDDAFRVYATPPGSHESSLITRTPNNDDGIGGEKENEEGSEAGEGNFPIKSANRRKRTPPRNSLRAGSSNHKTVSTRRESSAQIIGDGEGLAQSAKEAPLDSRGSLRSHKGNILGQVMGDSRKLFAKQAPEVIPAPRVPSIEAWLNDTLDPFVEGNGPPPGFVAPLKLSVEAKGAEPRKEVLEEVEDPNRILEALDTRNTARRSMVGSSKRRRRIPSSAIYEHNPFPDDFDSDTGLSGSCKESKSASKFIDLIRETPETSPSTLKRRSARRNVASPIRDTRKANVPKDSIAEDDMASGLYSIHTNSSVEDLDPSVSHMTPMLYTRRTFPTMGKHCLSTIASVETSSARGGVAAPPVLEVVKGAIHPFPVKEDDVGDEARDQLQPMSLRQDKSRLAKHSDLISVLSIPKPSGRSIQSARSIRTNRSRLATATVGDLMRELGTDEEKYMREIHTLVDGVIPVLLTCVLSKSDSAVAAGLFQPTACCPRDTNFTKPIVDMGIALERLRTLHKRIARDDPTALLTWAHGAHRVYAEYLKAWRMGFQDVVVNLAPAAGRNTVVPTSDTKLLDEGLSRNKDGDVINGDGERVDVAFLLKRPLVRLKYLQKTLKGINLLKPSAEAELLASRYQRLVDSARQRLHEERARLEDEAASNVDPTRTRDPRTLAPLAGVIIDQSRRVRARDNFDLALQHSSGQCVDCRIELILRDEVNDVVNGGDLLICEVDATGKWLLFPPVQLGRISARNGDIKGEIVIMIRGISDNRLEWQELFSLMSDDEQAGFEWVQMLGLTPVPPKITRSQSFLNKHQKRKAMSTKSLSIPETAIILAKSRSPSPRNIEVPIGEQAYDASKNWLDPVTNGLILKPSEQLQREPSIALQHVPLVEPSMSTSHADQLSDLHSLPSQSRTRRPVVVSPSRMPRSFKEALGLSGTSTSIGLKRMKAKKRSRYDENLRTDGQNDDRQRGFNKPISDSTQDSQSLPSSPTSLSQPRPSSPKSEQGYVDDAPRRSTDQLKDSARPSDRRIRSSVPSKELPYIPKARHNSPPTTPTFEVEQEPNWSSGAGPVQSELRTKVLEKDSGSSSAKDALKSPPPVSPTHHSHKYKDWEEPKTPILTSAQSKPRRSSSPLKHEYEPSTASGSSSESDTSTIEHKGVTSVSDSSDNEDLEEGDAPTSLLPLETWKPVSTTKMLTTTSSQPTPDGTIKPSESASQAPYKAVPAQPSKASKTIASIFSWSELGVWESLHPDECSVVITPGLIEAYQMSAAHSKDIPLSPSAPVADPDDFSDHAAKSTKSHDEVQVDPPLVALELTPLVPLRRGTALDISIRSPPTSNSQLATSNNIMFRSRNPEECEALYALINHSRINNPTFIALQNARASGSAFGNDHRASTSIGGSRRSWFGGWGRSSSYRASSAPTPSIAPSESSIGSMSSAFSALKRFGKGSNMFNISRSTITSREGSRANSVYTSSDNSSASDTGSPIPPGLLNAGRDAPIGLNNAKIRLYARETASRWRDMGSARLTITRPGNPNLTSDARPSSSTGNQGINEKRIVVNGKTKGEVLLDAQLGESCFERVARTGIAISVWEDVVGPNGEVGVVGPVGGVSGGRAKVYMIQVRKSPSRCDPSTEKLTTLIDEKRSRDVIYILHCR